MLKIQTIHPSTRVLTAFRTRILTYFNFYYVSRYDPTSSNCPQLTTKDVKIIATIFACIFPLIEAMVGGVDSTVIQVERCSY